MSFPRHAAKFLRAFGITPEAVDCPQTYDDLLHRSLLKDGVIATAHQMMSILGYDIGSVHFNFRDRETAENLCRLIGAPIGEVMPERERDILHFLARIALEMKPGDGYDPVSLLSKIISQHCDEFQNLADKVSGKPVYADMLPRNKAMEALAMTEAMVAARALARQYRIPMGAHPHPAVAKLGPAVERQESLERSPSRAA